MSEGVEVKGEASPAYFHVMLDGSVPGIFVRYAPELWDLVMPKESKRCNSVLWADLESAYQRWHSKQGLRLPPDPKPKFRNVLTVVRCWRDAVGEMNAMFATADGVQYEFWWDSKAGRWKPGNGYSETLLNERFVEYHNLVSAWDIWRANLPRVETAE